MSLGVKVLTFLVCMVDVWKEEDPSNWRNWTGGERFGESRRNGREETR